MISASSLSVVRMCGEERTFTSLLFCSAWNMTPKPGMSVPTPSSWPEPSISAPRTPTARPIMPSGLTSREFRSEDSTPPKIRDSVSPSPATPPPW